LITRRKFNKIAGLGLASAALGAPTELAASQDVMSHDLKQIILSNVKGFEDPWLLIHGVRAMGTDFSIQGQNVVDYLCSKCLEIYSVGGKKYIYMPLELERHLHCFLSEAVLDAGVAKDRSFQKNNVSFTVSDLVEGAKALYKPELANPDTLAWSIIVFAYAFDPTNDNWQNAFGTEVKVSSQVDTALLALEAGTRRLRQAMSLSTSEPTSDGVHEFACAGTHLIYGLITCLRLGYDNGWLQERMKPQFDLLIWRLKNDPRLIDAYYNDITAYPPTITQMYRLDTKLKFLGHAFETINCVKLLRLFEITPDQDDTISTARMELAGVVAEIVRNGIENLKSDDVLFDLIVGDACHAYHAVNMVSP
jgi:hypothetical protein